MAQIFLVFIVTFGSYDDYQILEVFSSEESANQYLREYSKQAGDRGRVETWEVNE